MHAGEVVVGALQVGGGEGLPFADGGASLQETGPEVDSIAVVRREPHLPNVVARVSRFGRIAVGSVAKEMKNEVYFVVAVGGIGSVDDEVFVESVVAAVRQ